MTTCISGTLPIESQILTGKITQVAPNNDFGKIKEGNTEFVYFNYNNQYQKVKLYDTINFFFTNSKNVIINNAGSVINYPLNTLKIGFNLHSVKKILLNKSKPPTKNKKGTLSDLPPNGLYSNIPGGDNSSYFINDCGNVHLLKQNGVLKKPWDRLEVSLVSSKHAPIFLYEYIGGVTGIWTP